MPRFRSSRPLRHSPGPPDRRLGVCLGGAPLPGLTSAAELAEGVTAIVDGHDEADTVVGEFVDH